MVTQYPHILTATVTGDATKDSNGDWTPGAENIKSQRCRAESASNNGYLTASDGVRLDYSWKVYMPQTTDPLIVGSSVTVTDGEIVLCKDTVKRFQKNFFNCIAWL